MLKQEETGNTHDLHRIAKQTLTMNIMYGEWLIGYRKQEAREGEEGRREGRRRMKWRKRMRQKEKEEEDKRGE